ncbi:MAG TPA: 16S rRNA (cytidine(1402)-2'-O)-methyltransferase [Thiotrichales bacterium]|nr:16S rRNA (cytidine(1402)-2'-O)-methyltransferase [Thiotrichales bacterium]
MEWIAAVSEAGLNVSNAAGTLFVVATPIGNLADFTLRARATLAEVDWIAAEDTRHTRKLLAHYGIHTPMVSLHRHNEERRSQELVQRLRDGDQGALVADAGTPLIRDPGYVLVRAAAAAGVQVSPVPGPCAAIAALSVSGLPADRFFFAGFLPAKGAARRARLQELAVLPVTLVFYEAAHRVCEALADFEVVLGPARPMVLARELTKRHETLLRGSIATVAARVRRDPEQRLGEFVLVVGAAPPPDAEAIPAEAERLLHMALAELPPRRAASLVSAFTGLPRNRLYALALRLQGQAPDHD